MKQPYRLDDPRTLGVAPPQHAHTRAAIAVAAAAVRDRFAVAPAVGIILGTGLGALAREIADPVAIEYESIPGFPLSTVESHAGRLIGGTLGGKSVVAMQGRFHLYEGYTAQQVSFPVRVMRELGARTLIVSNACGALNPEYRAGDLMLIGDHINLLGDNPLIGPNDDVAGPALPRHVRAVRRGRCAIARARGDGRTAITLREGVYAAVTGPSFETRAEYRMLRALGADVVGMSTVPEVIVAVHGGMKVLGISMITDLCIPDTLEPVTLERIVAVANAAEPNSRRSCAACWSACDRAPFPRSPRGPDRRRAGARDARPLDGGGSARAHDPRARGREGLRLLRGPAHGERPPRHPPRVLAHDQGSLLPLPGDEGTPRAAQSGLGHARAAGGDRGRESSSASTASPRSRSTAWRSSTRSAARACGSTRASGSG